MKINNTGAITNNPDIENTMSKKRFTADHALLPSTAWTRLLMLSASRP